MTRYQYNDVKLGSRFAEICGAFGNPYAIHNLGYGKEEYEYVERFSMNNELVYENHYFLAIVNGQIVSKRMRTESRPAYDQMFQEDPNYPSYP